MKKKIIAIGAIAITSISLTACTNADNSTTSDSTTTENTSTPAMADTTTEPSDFNTLFNQQYAQTKKMCALYGSLVNQGWTNDEIYNQLNDAGTFDTSYGQGKTVWHALIRWCFAN